MATADWQIDADTWMTDLNPDSNDGAGDTIFVMFVTAKETAEVQRSLARVDFSGTIPAGSTIDSADFYQWQVGGVADADARYRYYKVLRAWVEGEATWNIWSTGNNWTTGGCEGWGTDANVSIYSEDFQHPTYLIPGPPDMSFYVDVKDMVIDAIANESSVLSMVCHRTAGATDNDWQARSTEYVTVAHRPYLRIVWTPPGAAVAKKISGVAWANVKQVSGVAEASIKKVSGVQAN